MAVDWELAGRVRRALEGRDDVSEKRMFGGLCFLLGGNMLCAVDRGVMLFRVGREQHAAALKRRGARPVVMKGRAMRGFVWVGPEGYEGRGLRSWLGFARRHVDRLPPKPARKNRRTRDFSPLV